MDNQQTPKPYGKSYGKRPLWQWLVIYLIVGAIVYGAIYYFVYAKKGGYNYSNNNSGSNYNYNQNPGMRSY